MGLRAVLHDGSGKATCRLCKEIIKVGKKQITMYGYQTQGSVHGDRKDCKIPKHPVDVLMGRD